MINKKLLLLILLPLVVITDLTAQEAGKPSKAASLNAAWLRNKYQADTSFENAMLLIIDIKEKSLQRVLSAGYTEEDTKAKVNRIFHWFDSLQQRYILLAESNNYAVKQIAALDSIKKMPENEKQVLFTQLANRCKVEPESYKRHFESAFKSIITDSIILNAFFKEKIEQATAEHSRRMIDDLRFNYHLRDSFIRLVEPVIFEKAKALARLDQMPFSKKKDNLHWNIENKYNAIVNNILIRNGFYHLSNSRFALAMKYHKALGLSDEQQDQLAAKNLERDTLTLIMAAARPARIFDPIPYTREKVKAILTPEQYEKLLGIETHPQANDYALKHWAEMKAFGLTDGLDSAKICAQLMSYELRRLVTGKLYADDPKIGNPLVAELVKDRPAILKKLETQRSLKQKEDIAAKNFLW